MTPPPNGTRQEHIPDKARYLAIAETKKLLMADVRAAFPKTKFRCTTRNATLMVEWTNGPTWRSVKQVTRIFTNRGTMDSSDSVPAVDTWYNGELLYFGNSSVELVRHFSRDAVETVARAYCAWARCSPFEVIDEAKSAAINWNHPHADHFYPVMRVLDEEQYHTFSLRMHKNRVIVDQPLCRHCDNAYVDDTATNLCDACARLLADRATWMALIETPIPETATLRERLHLTREKYAACLKIIYTFGEDTALHEQYDAYYTQKSYSFDEEVKRLLAEMNKAKEAEQREPGKVIDLTQARSHLRRRP
jgi:Large polyvalent protein associated domain 29